MADSSVVTPEGEEITGTGRSGAKANEGSTTNVVVRGLTCRLSSRWAWVPRRGEIGTLFEWPVARELGFAALLSSTLTRDTVYHGQ